MLNLFYDEPDPDRWLPLDRYPRRLVRRILRGPPQPGGQMRVFLNLCAGLDQLGIPYRVNDHRKFSRECGEVACVVGKPHVLSQFHRDIPIIFGAAVHSHPIDAPGLFYHNNVQAILVPCEWMRKMCEPAWGKKVHVWPVGIDTNAWLPVEQENKDIDFLIYDKIRWRRDEYVPRLLDVISSRLSEMRFKTRTIRYGFYREDNFKEIVRRARAMIFLCEHETQGIALLQTLSSNVPVFAWERKGYWQDPAYFPNRVMFSPVTTVPYWDSRCGATFSDVDGFQIGISSFWKAVSERLFAPRSYVLEHLTLERAARHYLEIVDAVRRAAPIPDFGSVK